MARLDQETQNELEPKRIQYAVDRITEMGYVIIQRDSNKIQFEHKGSVVTLYPYSGWHTGKTITDGRGIHNLLKQLQHG